MTRPASFTLDTPADLGFDATVRSHGWFDLPPFAYGEDRVLRFAAEVPGAPGRALAISVAEERPRALRVEVAGAPAGAAAARAVAEPIVRTVLQVDFDLGPVHGALPRELGWARDRGAGRLLRSPTVFEDAVKVLFTTNCTWAATRGMVERLVGALGTPAPGGLRAFPLAARVAAEPASFFRDTVRAGYRAEALRDLARAVASGALAIEGWRDPARPTDDLRAAILALRGFGPYAADQMLRLAGRFDHPALDSWMRVQWRKLHPRSRLTDRRIVARYQASYGRLAGLVLWLELTREWHDTTEAFPWP